MHDGIPRTAGDRSRWGHGVGRFSIAADRQATAPEPVESSSATDWLILQIADTAFPAGSLPHSGGLEAACQHGVVGSVDDFRDWIEASLRQVAQAQLPLVAAVHREPDRLGELDRLADAWITNHVAHRASRQQGRAFWMATGQAFALPGAGADAPAPGHFAPVFAVRCRNLGLSFEATVRVFLFLQLRGWISAGIRLGIVGPLAAQQLQFGLMELAGELARNAPALDLDDLAQNAPLLDLWQGAQDRLHARLFQS